MKTLTGFAAERGIMPDYGQPLGDISDALMQRALDRFDLGRLISVKPTTTGNFRQNLFVTTDRGAFVFRGAPHYAWQFPKEAYFARLLHSHVDVPTPWPYLLESSMELFGWPYVFMGLLPGEQIATPDAISSLAKPELMEVAASQGHTLAQLHQAHLPMAGDYDLETGTLRPFQHGYVAWTVSEAHRMLASTGCLAAEDTRWVRAQINALAANLSEPTHYAMVHGDFHNHNQLFRREAGSWRLSGVFDLMTATIGDAVADVPRQWCLYRDEWPDAARVFLSSYQRHAATGDDFAARFNLYMFADRLIIRDFAWRHQVDWLDWTRPPRDWFTRMLLTPDGTGERRWMATDE